MLDVETLDVNETAVVTQVALVRFDFETAVYNNLNIDEQLKLGSTISHDTLQWWSIQNQKVFQGTLTNPILLKELSDSIYTMLMPFGKDYKIWCHAGFDFPKLNRLLRLAGKPEMHYRSCRDLRTLLELATANGFNMQKFYDMDNSSNHDALVDCSWQIKWATEALTYVKKG